MSDTKPIANEDLLIHVLNVGRGDTIVVEMPMDNQGMRSYGVVDCYDFEKLAQYLDTLRNHRPGRDGLDFLCATHPHSDHILGIRKLIETERFRPREFWDSGFRHASQTYKGVLEALNQMPSIDGRKTPLVRISSGTERYYGRVRITALAPSVMLRNTYATYGVDINNASIVLRIEHHEGDTLFSESTSYDVNQPTELRSRPSPSTVILGGDAEFDSWARINEEFPQRKAISEIAPRVEKMINMLDCSVLKVSHHGSMHSIPLEVLERMKPAFAVISTEQTEGVTRKGKPNEYSRSLFPHPTTMSALKETCASVLSTDGTFDWPAEGDKTTGEPGSIVIAVPPGGRPRCVKLNDTRNSGAEMIDEI